MKRISTGGDTVPAAEPGSASTSPAHADTPAHGVLAWHAAAGEHAHATIHVATVDATSAAGDGNVRWGELADPLRRIAGYLYARDCASLSQVSRGMRQMVAGVTHSALALSLAAQTCTMSRLQQVLDVLARHAGPDGQKAAVLAQLARRIHWLPYPRHEAAWTAVLEAGMALSNGGAAAAVLVALADIAPEFQDCRRRLARLDRLASDLGPPHDIAVHVASMSTLMHLEGQGYHWDRLANWPFDLRSCLARASKLAAQERHAANSLIVSFHCWRASSPDEAWQEGMDAIMQMSDPQDRAAALIPMVSHDRKPDRRPLLYRTSTPVQCFRQALRLAAGLPTQVAVDAVLGMQPACRAGTSAQQLEKVEAILSFGEDPRLNPDQRLRIRAAMLTGLPPEQRFVFWHELLQCCQREGLNAVRRDCLVRQCAAMVEVRDDAIRQRHWDGVLASCPPPGPHAELAALLCGVLAQHLPSLPVEVRPAASLRLFERIRMLQPKSLAYLPIADVLPHLPVDKRTAVANARWSVPSEVAARWLTALLGAGHGTSAVVTRLVDALLAQSKDDALAALLVGAIEGAVSQWVQGGLDVASLALFMDGVAKATDGFALPCHDNLVAAMCALATVALQQDKAATAPHHGAIHRRCVDHVLRAVNGMPVERRQALLLRLVQGRESRLPGEGHFAPRRHTALIVKILPSMPPLYRVPVLLAWLKMLGFDTLPWADQREMWQAIKAIPPVDQAALLQNAASLFWRVERAGCEIEPEELPEWEDEKAQWRAALSRLPAIDALEVHEPVWDNDEFPG